MNRIKLKVKKILGLNKSKAVILPAEFLIINQLEKGSEIELFLEGDKYNRLVIEPRRSSEV